MKIADTSGQDTLVKKPSSTKRYWLSGLIVVVLVFIYLSVAPALSNWGASDTSISLQGLRLATVTMGDFVRDLSVQGRVVAAVSPRLYSPAQGTITFRVDAGDNVSKDQVLAVIDSPELSNELKQEQAGLQRLQMELDRERIESKKQGLDYQKSVDLAKVSLTAADREKRRADKAFATQSISQIDYEKPKMT